MVDFAKIQNFDSDFGLDENFQYDAEIGTIIADTDLFGSEEAPVDTVYVGVIGEASRYLGLRTEAQLYLGAKNLWP